MPCVEDEQVLLQLIMMSKVKKNISTVMVNVQLVLKKRTFFFHQVAARQGLVRDFV